ncbi:hypothetical protein BC826DRAFT_977929 [Russula brevipes]|nr:hypothetical protein BC826DRAFT_977929 [Russula brevipes]
MDRGKVKAKVNSSNVITLQSRPLSRPPSPSKAKPLQPPSPMLAAIVIGRSSSSSATEQHSTVKSIPRPPSPFKRPHGHARKLSSTRSAVDVQLSRPKASLAPRELSRQRSLTSTLGASSNGARRSSGAFHPAPPTPPSPHVSPDNPPQAKVSTVAKSSGIQVSPSPTPTSSLHPSPPPFATIRPIESRSQAHSITELRAPTVPAAVHPITTPTPAANPHRYAPRVPPNTASPRFQSFSPPSSRDLDNGVPFRVTSKVDPAVIPLPPQSPPTSTLSFSSQSSKDTQGSSSARDPALSTGPTFDVFDDASDPNSPRHSLGSPATHADQLEDPDRKIRAEAKTNRKIEDLEITNRSLLAINATLEATKHKQATEIRELRRKLRESRLILPPPTFRAIKSSLGPEDIADDEDVGDDDDDDDDDSDDDGDAPDETYRRIKGILEGLLETGRRALRVEPRDFEKQSGGVKVLSAEEVRSWRGDVGDDRSSIHSAPTDAGTDEENHSRRNLPTASQAAPSRDCETDNSIISDRKAGVVDGDELDSGSLPPITVTFS